MDDQQNDVTIGSAWQTLLSRSGFRPGGSKSLLVNALVIAAFGVLVPWRRGIDFFDPLVIFVYSAIAVLFAGSAITDLLAANDAGDRPVPAIVASALFGWATAAIIYIAGIVTVNLDYGAKRFLHPSWSLFSSTLLFAFTAALLLAAFAAMLGIVFSPAIARTSIRLLFVLVLIAGYLESNYLSADWQMAVRRQMNTPGLTRIGLIGSAVAVVLAGGLIFALRRSREKEVGVTE